jgi:hypothetical protein
VSRRGLGSPHPLLGPAGGLLGFGPLRKRGLYLGQHRVQCSGELANLRARIGIRHSV